MALFYRLAELGVEAKLSLVARELKVKPPTALKMLDALRAKGYVERRGPAYVLTDRGVEGAERVIKNHRILERFLSEFLRADAREAHELAHKLEHLDRLAELASAHMAGANSCPHGNPLPGRSEVGALLLVKVREGRYVVTRIGELRPALEWLDKLRVGQEIEVLEFRSHTLRARVGGELEEIPLEVARLIYVVQR